MTIDTLRIFEHLSENVFLEWCQNFLVNKIWALDELFQEINILSDRFTWSRFADSYEDSKAMTLQDVWIESLIIDGVFKSDILRLTHQLFADTVFHRVKILF